jgi:hypothetical protein
MEEGLLDLATLRRDLLRNPPNRFGWEIRGGMPKKPYNCRWAIFWEIKAVERAEQEGKGGTVGHRSKGSFKAVRLRPIDCANLPIAVWESESATLDEHAPRSFESKRACVWLSSLGFPALTFS